MVHEDLIRRSSTIGLVVCLAALGMTTALVLSPGLRAAFGVGPAAPPPAYAAGERVDLPSHVFDSADTTLILFARSTCNACQGAGPFYRRVVDLASTRAMPAWVVTPIADLEIERVYAATVGVRDDRVIYMAPGAIRLRSVPALMMVNRAGIIQHVWFSQPDAAAESAILDTVTKIGGVPAS